VLVLKQIEMESDFFKVYQEIVYGNIIYEVFQRNKTSQQNSIVLFELAEDL
jgi:hypothetical protein